MMEDSTPCTVCGGSKKDHFDENNNPKTLHVYTTREGELMTPAEKAKQQGRQPQQMPGMMMSLGANPMALGRLVEVMIEAGVLTTEDALYIGGMGQKPASRQSGYMDPATVMRVQR